MSHHAWSKAIQRPSELVWRAWARRRGSRVPKGRLAPRLEALEDRTVLSTLTVTNNQDNGAVGSLRYEISNASSGDTINFARSLTGRTITLTTGDLAITKSLDIEGPANGRLTISGGGSRVFEIGSGATVTLAHLTIANGVVSGELGGGGILNDAG